MDNIHYHQFDEETSWKLRIPLVRSGGYLLTPNPGEGVKEDMNSQLDLLHMNDEQVWSLTKVGSFLVARIIPFILFRPTHGGEHTISNSSHCELHRMKFNSAKKSLTNQHLFECRGQKWTKVFEKDC